jgi:hypothetical protein
VTPTGIVLSRKPEISVTAVTEKKNVALTPKAISAKRESVSKAENLGSIKAKSLLEMKDAVVHATVSEMNDGLPRANC